MSGEWLYPIFATTILVGGALSAGGPEAATAPNDLQPSVLSARAGFLSSPEPNLWNPGPAAKSPHAAINLAQGNQAEPYVVLSPRAGDPRQVPYKWAGLWEIDTPPPDDNFTMCTAQFIAPRVILLAAHCIRDQQTGKYYDEKNKGSFFLLQWQNNQFSRAYHALCKMTWDEWVAPLKPGEDPHDQSTWSKESHEKRNKAWQWDYGFVLLDADSITGYYKYDQKHAVYDIATSTGYPAAPVGSSAVIEKDFGDIFITNNLRTLRNIPNVQVLWHGNPQFTQGASGGAWVLNISEKEGPDLNVIVGLNSFEKPSRPGAMFSPLLTGEFDKMLSFASKCEPK
jgi:hypothetical protein